MISCVGDFVGTWHVNDENFLVHVNDKLESRYYGGFSYLKMDFFNLERGRFWRLWGMHFLRIFLSIFSVFFKKTWIFRFLKTWIFRFFDSFRLIDFFSRFSYTPATSQVFHHKKLFFSASKSTRVFLNNCLTIRLRSQFNLPLSTLKRNKSNYFDTNSLVWRMKSSTLTMVCQSHQQCV